MKTFFKVLFGVAIFVGLLKVAQILINVLYEQTNKHYISVNEDE